MYGETKSDMLCTEFEQLLAEALDGLLGGERLNAFEAHAAACPNCGLETLARTGAEAVVYGGCRHFSEVRQTGAEIAVVFEGLAA